MTKTRFEELIEQKKLCWDIRYCNKCDKLLTCQAVDSMGLDCYKKHYRNQDNHCSRHGGGKSYWKKGELLVDCQNCKNEHGDQEAMIIVYDKNRNWESCGCKKRWMTTKLEQLKTNELNIKK